MPIYEYKCLKCFLEFEFFIHKLYEDKPKCPNCDCEDLEKLMSASNSIFKGGGFHKTDYKKGEKNGKEGSSES